MKNIRASVGVIGIVALLCGCDANGITKVPGLTQTSLPNIGKLQLAVGTVNIGTDSNATGLNVVTTFRQADGDSAVLLDTPTLTGPSGFTVSASNTSPYVTVGSKKPDCSFAIETAGVDSGTASISGDPQATSNLNSTFVPQHTFGTAGLVGSYGIQPFNETAGAAAYYPGKINGADCGTGYPAYPQPFYLSQGGATALAAQGLGSAPSYIGGPPAYPFFNDGSAPGGFAGYVSGFTAIEATPVAGTYTLKLVVPAANASGQTFSATGTLSSVTPLPNLPAPTFTTDGTGGGTVSVNVPSDPRITETMIYIQAGGLYFAVGPLSGTGTVSGTLPDNLGVCSTVGCKSGTSISSGTAVFVYAASYDYPAYEASPGNLTSSQGTSQTPTITGSGGQADVTLSPVTASTE